jgi:hypothetical protein
MAAFVFVIIIAFFLVFEFLIFRREIKKILVPTVIFFSISIAISLIYWIPFLFIENFVPQISQQNANAGTTDRWNSLFIASNITQRLLYPFLFHYVPFVYPRSPLAHHYVFFGYGTAVLFVIALFSIFSNKTWIKSIEKRLLVSGFIVTYLFPLHSIVTRTFYFAPTRFVIFLELFSSLLVLVSFNKKLVNRYYILLTIIWLIVLFFTIRWYAYAIFYD